jgi:hypothetical protein
MKAGKQLKAYCVTSDYSDYSVLVFAENSNKAKSHGHGADNLCDEDYTTLHAARLKKADKFAEFCGEGYVPFTDKYGAVFYEIGWYFSEDDKIPPECDKCGKHEFASIPESKIVNGICTKCSRKGGNENG